MRVRKLKASSIAEIAIALSIIAICFALASRLFIQSARSTVQFQETIEQSEFQSVLFTSYSLDSNVYNPKLWEDKLTTIETVITEKDSVRTEQLLLKNSVKTNWMQEFTWPKER
ncbi:MAG: hypothetical protein K0S23_1255 [Fluviicola sp.]|jgi:hypothetical protein|uniref:hypothetical protein n=1 Tax=Fluviicola sp. TaxID=1917219 RepID=UPI0026045C68|nr:hypothetical protein [Fluviicola sp.]MDF3026948.1 hypothetical protein [Fluviicola sp.]